MMTGTESQVHTLYASANFWSCFWYCSLDIFDTSAWLTLDFLNSPRTRHHYMPTVAAVNWGYPPPESNSSSRSRRSNIGGHR